MWPWWLSWQCPRRHLGNQADIWGFWPGARLWHPDGRGRRGGWRPEDHLPRVSDSFSLDYHAFNLDPLLRLLPFLPGSPCYLQQSLDILATRIPCNYAWFFSHSFPLHPPFGTLASFPPPPLPTSHPPAPLSLFLSPPESFFVFLVPFLYHFIIIHRSNPWKIDATPRCQSSAISMLKARSQRDCMLPWQPAFWCSLLEFAPAGTFLWLLLLIVPKFTTLIKVFMEQQFFFFCWAA